MIKVLQGNLHRSRVADDLLEQIVREKEIDVVIISEQYKNKNIDNWFADRTNTAAIWLVNPNKIYIERHGAEDGFVWIESNKITLISCYFTPNQTAREYSGKLEKLEDAVTEADENLIVAGDFNAKAVEWGMPHTNSRGRQILEMAARRGLAVMNVGNTSTFRRPGYAETIPDISLASENSASSIGGWEVLEDYTGSDHQYIYFEIRTNGRTRVGNNEAHNVAERKKWNVAKLDKNKMAEALSNGVEEITQNSNSQNLEGRTKAESVARAAINIITRACDVSMPRKRSRENRRPVYWWTNEIADLRRKSLQLRRVAQRARNRPDTMAALMEYKTARKTLRIAIKKSKTSKWRALCEEVNEDPWGMGYKIVLKKISAPVAENEMEEEVMENIVDTLFPTHPRRSEVHSAEVIAEVPTFTQKELEEAANALKNRKAPGPDGIPVEAIKVAVATCPQMMLKVYNTCLEEGVFCKRWKQARLVLINKGKGEQRLASSYRPLCMLDTAGKLLEKLLKTRLEAAIRVAGGLADTQFGFRRGKSTIDAIQTVTEAVKESEAGNHHSRKIVMLVTLDVKNAFNSAKWVDIIEALKHYFGIPAYLLRMIEDYLYDRSLVYNTKNGTRRKEITAGAAQGSILGPDLWNVLYDSLLRMEMPDNTSLVGYADDVAAIITAREMEEVQTRLNQVMRRVNGWMNKHGLELAAAKTEIVILTKKRIPTIIPIEVGVETIQTKEAAKYLGIILDTKLNYWQQIKHVTDKAVAITNKLSRLMANIGGPKPCKRRLIMTTVESILLYGAEIWADALNKEYCRRRIAAVQRTGALRIACSYRTVSSAAVTVIANVIPIDLLARERKKIYERDAETSKKEAAAEARRSTLAQWQERWSSSHSGRWTVTLIPQLENWVSRKHGEVNYYITQFLSGHGYFRSYLYKMGKVNSPRCRHCDAEEDTPSHTFFECSVAATERNIVVATVGPFSADNIINIMLHGEDKWNIVAIFIETVLRKKKRLGYLEDNED